MFHDCRSERKLWASATVNRADPMLSRTSSENPSDPSLRAASEKNSSSSYSLEIITALRWQWEWQKQWDSTCEVASLLTEGRRRNNTRRFRRALMLGWRWPAEHLNILIDHYLVGRHRVSQVIPSTTVVVDSRTISCLLSIWEKIFPRLRKERSNSPTRPAIVLMIFFPNSTPRAKFWLDSSLLFLEFSSCLSKDSAL